MFRDAQFRLCLLVAVLLTFALGPLEARAQGQTQPCFDVRVEFRGRVPTQNIGGVQYYSWTYRVYGNGCINRGLSHWVLGLCPSTAVSGVSTQSIDASDPPGGMVTNYMWSLGKDPTTLVAYGLKWDWVAGNQIDRLNEYDEFSFIASGPIVTVNWVAKGGRIVVSGTTQGPGCSPVASQPETWSGIKSRFR